MEVSTLIGELTFKGIYTNGREKNVEKWKGERKNVKGTENRVYSGKGERLAAFQRQLRDNLQAVWPWENYLTTLCQWNVWQELPYSVSWKVLSVKRVKIWNLHTMCHTCDNDWPSVNEVLLASEWQLYILWWCGLIGFSITYILYIYIYLTSGY